MKAKFVYESIGDILKGKNANEIVNGIDSRLIGPPMFSDMFKILITKGYLPQLFNGVPEDYEKNTYSYKGHKIITGNAAWISLKAQKELDFYLKLKVRLESNVSLIQLENEMYVPDIGIQFYGDWKTRTTENKIENVDFFYDGDQNKFIEEKDNDTRVWLGNYKMVPKEQVIPLFLEMLEQAEKFVQTEIYHLKLYIENMDEE